MIVDNSLSLKVIFNIVDIDVLFHVSPFNYYRFKFDIPVRLYMYICASDSLMIAGPGKDKRLI